MNYASVETLLLNEKEKALGKNILIGNSATPTNNHLEIFDCLRQLNIGNRSLIAPLSYGDSAYRDEIVKTGYDIFGSNFKPILNFLPLEQYHHVITDCSTVIMNHVRQQALGNIVAALYRGARVYLNPLSTVFAFFNNRGAHIFDITKIKELGNGIFDPLPDENAQENRDIIDSFWGHQVVLGNIAKLYSILYKRNRSNEVL